MLKSIETYYAPLGLCSRVAIYRSGWCAPRLCLFTRPTREASYIYPRQRITGELLDRQLALGRRRSGAFLYYMNCERCRACQPSRVLVDEFVLTTSLRRVMKKGDALVTVPLHLAAGHKLPSSALQPSSLATRPWGRRQRGGGRGVSGVPG